MGLVISEVYGVTNVLIEDMSLLDPVSIEAMGQQLYALVDAKARRKVVVDFHRVRHLSSQMIGVVIELHKKSKAIKGHVVLCGLTGDVRRGFTITRLDKLLNIAKDENDALRLIEKL